MWKTVAIAALAMTFAGAVAAQTGSTSPPRERGPNTSGPTGPTPYQRTPSREPTVDRTLRGGGNVDLNNNSATGRPNLEQGSGATSRRAPISPGTGARDSGVPDSSTYNPGTPATR